MISQSIAVARTPATSFPQRAHPIAVSQDHDALDHVTIVAHDLRNYLTPLYTRLQMLCKSAERDGRDQDLQLALGAASTIEQMHVLINNVLDTERINRGLFDLQLAACDVGALVRETAALLHTDGTPISIDLADGLMMQADGERLRQAFHNLLANAVQYSPSGAPALVRGGWERRDGAQCAVLEIHDRGPGIAPEQMPTIFERGITGPHSRGLGLGLYLARHIVQAHGGTVAVQSTLGVGTCVEVVLPLAFHLRSPIEP